MLRLLHHFIIFILIFQTMLLKAQNSLFQSNLMTIIWENGDTLPQPLTGGLKFPVFSEMDLNNDTYTDLIVLDRADNRLLTFINKGIKDSVCFVYRPQFEKYFPACEYFIRLEDYNRDGLKDIFTFSSPANAGITVYKNVSMSPWKPEFKMTYSTLPAWYYKTFYSNLYVSGLDLPVVKDLDGDGDLDILTFGVLGQLVELYDNIGLEKYGTYDSLFYEFADACWGKFREDELTNKLILGYSCAAVRGQQGGMRHAGSTLELFDFDNDGDNDLILGDVQYPTLALLMNGRKEYQLNVDSMIATVSSFPWGTSVNIRNMPSAFFIDVNNDGQKDLISAPMDMEIIDTFENLNQIWLYLDNDPGIGYNFQLHTKSFLQNQMLDLGGSTRPVFFDVDGDGKKDLLIATAGNFAKTYYKQDRIYYFRNVSKNSNPVFQLINNDFLNLSLKNLSAVSPAFGDVDGDGDSDLLIGLKNGRFMYYENQAKTGQSPDFVYITELPDSISAGSYATPCLIDYDGDGDDDLIAGTGKGNLVFFKNETNGGNIRFLKVTDSLGGISFSPGNQEKVFPCTGDINNDQKPDLILGTTSMGVYCVQDIVSNLFHTFELDTPDFRDYLSMEKISRSVGRQLFPAVFDVNQDGHSDLLLGNLRGGLLFYSSVPDTVNVSVREMPTYSFPAATLFPNPANEKVFLSFEKPLSEETIIYVFDLNGKKLYEKKLLKETTLTEIDTQLFPPGCYFIHIHGKKMMTTKKLLKL